MKLTYRQITQARGILRKKGTMTVAEWGSPIIALKLTKIIRLLDAEMDDLTKLVTDYATSIGFDVKATSELAKLGPRDLEDYRIKEAEVLEFQRIVMSTEVDVELPEIKLSSLADRVTLNDLAYLEPILVLDD